MKRGTVREDGMIYIRKNRDKEIWGTKQEFERTQKWRKEYMEKRRNMDRSLPENKKYKIGQYNPENGLYFIRKSGNLTAIWGTEEQLLEYRKKRKAMKVVYIQKMKVLKKEKMSNLERRWRRGDLDPVLGLVFFKYNSDNGSQLPLARSGARGLVFPTQGDFSRSLLNNQPFSARRVDTPLLS